MVTRCRCSRYALSALYERRGPRRADQQGRLQGRRRRDRALHRQADRIVEELTHQGLGSSVLPTLLKLTAVESTVCRSGGGCCAAT